MKRAGAKAAGPKNDGAFAQVVTSSRATKNKMETRLVKFSIRSEWTLLALMVIASGCAGPQISRVSRQKHQPLMAQAPVDVYINQLDPPYEEIAVIDSQAFPVVDDASKERQIEEL